MNGDNPSQSRPLAASLRKGPLLSGWQAKKNRRFTSGKSVDWLILLAWIDLCFAYTLPGKFLRG
ncbi:hypothetical protein ACQV0U_04320 [Salmonella enterica]